MPCHLITLYSLRESFKAIWSYEQAIKLGLCVHFSRVREWNGLSLCVQQETEGLGRREYAWSLYRTSSRNLFWERTQLSLLARRSRSHKDLTLWILPWSGHLPCLMESPGCKWACETHWTSEETCTAWQWFMEIRRRKDLQEHTAYETREWRLNLVFAQMVVEEDKARKWELECMNVFMT